VVNEETLLEEVPMVAHPPKKGHFGSGDLLLSRFRSTPVLISLNQRIEILYKE
jgi:hypothetical protein